MNLGVGKKEAMKNKGKKRVVSGDKWENGVMEAGKNRGGKKKDAERRGERIQWALTSQSCPNLTMVEKVRNSIFGSHTAIVVIVKNYNDDRSYIYVSKCCHAWLCDLSLKISEQTHEI